MKVSWGCIQYKVKVQDFRWTREPKSFRKTFIKPSQKMIKLNKSKNNIFYCASKYLKRTFGKKSHETGSVKYGLGMKYSLNTVQ